MPTSKALRRWLAELQDARQLVIDPAFGWNEPSRAAETICAPRPGRCRAGGRAGAARGRPGRRSRWAAAWTDAGAGRRGRDRRRAGGRSTRPSEPGAHAALGGLYADGDLVYTASSMPIRDQEAFLPSGPADVRFLCNRGANGIDGLISSGIGAAAASGRPTWIITGDLGLFHDMNGLATLREAGAPVRIVVLNNDGGGIFEFLPQADQIDQRRSSRRCSARRSGSTSPESRRCTGLEHRRIESLDELGDASRADAPMLIEVPVERRGNVELHRSIAEAGISAVRSLVA